MKHAYLILAHTDFDVLERLLHSIDDARNDVYIHFDAKLADTPRISLKNAGLFVLADRVDVRWGDFSVVEAEFRLFSEALKKHSYSYYHLLSGVDLTLKSQDYIHSFFDANDGKEFIGFTLLGPCPEIERKVMRWHLFPGEFRNAPLWKRALRHLFIRLQELLGIRRNRNIDFKKGSQWVSITERMARIFTDNIGWARKHFTHTFCPDEIVMQTLCWNSPARENIFSLKDDATGCMRAISWKNGEMCSWTEEDYLRLEKGEALFARKFVSNV